MNDKINPQHYSFCGVIRLREWTIKEIQYLKENYSKIPIKELAKRLNRTENAIKTKAQKLKIKGYRKVYALYKGDQLRGIGTVKELARKLNIKEQTIWCYGTPVGSKRSNTALVEIRDWECDEEVEERGR